VAPFFPFRKEKRTKMAHEVRKEKKEKEAKSLMPLPEGMSITLSTTGGGEDKKRDTSKDNFFEKLVLQQHGHVAAKGKERRRTGNAPEEKKRTKTHTSRPVRIAAEGKGG